MKDLMIYLTGLVCGMILMGVALGESTHVYVGQWQPPAKDYWTTIVEDGDLSFVERYVERENGRPNYGLEARVIERSCTENVLRTWHRKPANFKVNPR